MWVLECLADRIFLSLSILKVWIMCVLSKKPSINYTGILIPCKFFSTLDSISEYGMLCIGYPMRFYKKSLLCPVAKARILILILREHLLAILKG